MSPVAYMRGMDNPFRPDPQLITSPDDPRIADYLSVRERDSVCERGRHACMQCEERDRE